MASIAVFASLVPACSNSKDSVAAKGNSPGGIPLEPLKVQLRPMAQHLTVSSELVPFQEIDVYAKEAGYVKQLNVDYGSHVRAGEVMAVLEIPELEAQLQQDEAAIKARGNEVTRAKNDRPCPGAT